VRLEPSYRFLPLLSLGFVLSIAAPRPAEGADPYLEQLAAWKSSRIERLQRPDGWLTLIGLAWLREGDNAVGSHPESAVRLPAGKAPERLGTLRLSGGKVVFAVAPGERVLAGGTPVTTLELASDAAADGPTVLEHGSLRLNVIDRSGKLGVRIKDSEARALKEFRGLEYYPADPKWRVAGRFAPHATPQSIEIPTSAGITQRIDSPGTVTLTLEGVERTLLAFDDTGDGRLFLVFGDRTNGRETYGGGRFLYTDPPADGAVEVDFNRAYNPPCVFTPWATCPLPPPGNKLPVRIAAGETKFAGGVHP
jgi:uncharacterized protein (DUF1684 family)